jgi:hypothetical protein
MDREIGEVKASVNSIKEDLGIIKGNLLNKKK